VQALRYAIDTHLEAERRNRAMLLNNAVPGGVITTEQILNEQQINMYRSQWNELYKGSENANKVAIMPKGMGFQSVQQSNQEMQFIEGMHLNRDEILANFGVGLEILGKTESQTRANADTAVYVFMRFGVLPFIEKFVDTLNNDYLPAFPGTEDLEFVFDDPVPENTEEKRLNATTLFAIGAVTPNEVRKQFGLEPLPDEGMDVPYMDFNKMPVGGSPPLAL
jgi:HK97 family phage portal protein